MAKFEYKLSHNEAIIMKSEHVYRGKAKGELILTNQNLVHVVAKGMFKTTYITQQYPINQIKIFGGKAQTLLGKNGNVDIYFVDGQESFRFWNDETLFSEKKAEKEAIKWVDALNQLIKGEEVDIGASANTATIGTEIIADALGGTVSAFKDALGIKSKKSSTDSIERVTKKCSSCGAPVSGIKGKIARCPYCDTDQEL